MSPVRAQTTRGRLALVACALWLVSVEGMPALHEATHGELAPHRHDVGSIVKVSFDDTTHRHPDGSVHYVAPKPQPQPRRAARAPDGLPHVVDLGHFADGLAHHAAALAPPAPPVTRPLPVDRRPIPVVLSRSIELVACEPVAATARGPPAIA